MLNVVAPLEWMSFFAKSRCPTKKNLLDYFEWRKMSLCWMSLCLVSLYWMLLCEHHYSEWRYAERCGAPGMNVVFCQIKVSYQKKPFWLFWMKKDVFMLNVIVLSVIILNVVMRASLIWVSLCWMLWRPWNECRFLPNQVVLPKKQKNFFIISNEDGWGWKMIKQRVLFFFYEKSNFLKQKEERKRLSGKAPQHSP